MPTALGHSAPADRATRAVMACWPRLMDLPTAAAYTCLGISTLRDYCNEGILSPVSMPGSTLRDRQGNIIARGKARKIAKILITRESLDALIDAGKADA
jgi:hypothetical protein